MKIDNKVECDDDDDDDAADDNDDMVLVVLSESYSSNFFTLFCSAINICLLTNTWLYLTLGLILCITDHKHCVLI